MVELGLGGSVCAHKYFEYQRTRPGLSGWTCLFSQGGSHGESHDSFIHKQTRGGKREGLSVRGKDSVSSGRTIHALDRCDP